MYLVTSKSRTSTRNLTKIEKSWITHPGLFSKNIFIVFTFNIQVKTWYSNVKKVSEMESDKSGGIYPIHCVLNRVLKRETQNWFYSLSLSQVVLYWKHKDLAKFLRLFHFFRSNFWWKYMVSKVLVSRLGYMVLRVRSTWFRKYGVHGFGGTGYRAQAHNFSLPLTK